MSIPSTEFPEVHWERLRQEMEEHGPEGVIRFIGSFEPKERLNLYSFAQRAFNSREFNVRGWGGEKRGKNFDDYIEVAQAGIAEAMRQSEEATEEERKFNLKDFGNMMSYNLAADLAHCWPGDEMPREQKHFEIGLKAAENCIRWREELNKPASRRSMACWARGMHQISLGNPAAAADSFELALDYSLQDAAENNRPGGISPESSFDTILDSGYLGIAEALMGKPEGRERYIEACRIFRTQAEQFEDKKEDATFGLEQLETVEKRYLKDRL